MAMCDRHRPATSSRASCRLAHDRMMPTLLDGAGMGGSIKSFSSTSASVPSSPAGPLGGIVFGVLADRWGRRWTMAITIAIYSVFTGVSALARMSGS